MLCHRTPPFHGVSIMGDLMYDYFIKNKFVVKSINITTSKNIKKSNNIFKFYFLIKKIFIYFKTIYIFKPNIIYITPSITNFLFYRDFIILEITRIFIYIFNLKIKIYIHIHMRPYEISMFRKNILYKLYFRNTNVIFLSHLLIKDFPSFIFKKCHIHILPNTIQAISNKENAISSLNKFDFFKSKDNTIIITYFGHLIESKGYRRALLIAKELSKKNISINFHFYGDFGSNRDKNYFHQFITINKLHNIVFYKGICSRIDIWKVFNLTHILIFPTYTEAFPLTILEALSVGIPVISTSVGAIPELINNDQGILIRETKDENLFINNFVQSIEIIILKWDKYLSIKSINTYYEKWDSIQFQINISNIFKNH